MNQETDQASAFGIYFEVVAIRGYPVVNWKALLTGVAVAAIAVAGILTLLTWPPFKGSSSELAHSPAWWQFEWLAAIGFWLSALPSLAVYRLNDLFASAEHLRYPFMALLMTIEVILLSLLAYIAVTRASARSGRATHNPANPS